MAVGQTADLLSSAVGATVLASIGLFAQTASPPSLDGLSVLGGLAQVGSSVLVLYTVQLFLKDRKETEKDMASERKSSHEHFDAIVGRMERMHTDAMELADKIKDENRDSMKDLAKTFDKVIDRMERLHLAAKCGVPVGPLDTVPLQSPKEARR